jgi:hypothetical protein
MTASRQEGQSPADRKAAEGAVRRMIATHAPAHARLIAAARKRVRDRLPTAFELAYEYKSWIVFSFSPTAHGHQGVLAVRADEDGVKLYFQVGKGLPDPERLLRGSGTKVRYIALEGTAALRRPAVDALIEAALKQNRVPFAASGKGPLVIRAA